MTTTLSDPASSAIPDRCYNTQELAQLLRVHVNTVLRWAKTGILPPGHRFGSTTIRWTDADLASFLAARRREVTP
jgi:excisionase family DNA binding protein